MNASKAPPLQYYNYLGVAKLQQHVHNLKEKGNNVEIVLFVNPKYDKRQGERAM